MVRPTRFELVAFCFGGLSYLRINNLAGIASIPNESSKALAINVLRRFSLPNLATVRNAWKHRVGTKSGTVKSTDKR